MSRIAVVVFNLGGPDRPEAVEPFLFNLFNDPAIIGLPGPLRWLLAKVISRRRAPVAQEIYRELGGGSPLLPNTQAQVDALQAQLNDGTDDYGVFIAMRYWHPRAAKAAREVAAFAPDQVLLVPLYPQFSTTTSGSSLKEWHKEAKAAGISAPSRSLCCYPEEPGFVAATAAKLREALRGLEHETAPRVLFSAHGLPKKIVEKGDPYQWQVEQSVAAVVKAMGEVNLDWVVCYQSRVGPLEWIGPSTDAEIERAGREGRPLIVVPIAFISEHSETLVELDIEYRKLAEDSGVPAYVRVTTVSCDEAFIGGLAKQIRAIAASDRTICSQDRGRICPARWSGCPQAPHEAPDQGAAD
ncbi:ferrochelatase [Pelagibius litoralis]|uniref:Ferrochelatase n=1 Tax=Pelagibius litoralis TaxID=374515 RepID=A0A967F297_9PROT|nr:ferrochelatase [Pelagibius litoralis]NIA71708.1 ferrochelatase [Pelagibius litoralis]